MTKNFASPKEKAHHKFYAKLIKERTTSLYKALSDGAKPQFETILKVLRAVGGHLHVKTA